MFKKSELDSAIESLREEIAAIRTSLSDLKNDVIEPLHEENISLKNRVKTLDAQSESSDITRNKMNQYRSPNYATVDNTPSSMKKRDLKNKCKEVLGKIDIKIHEYGIKACHHLG